MNAAKKPLPHPVRNPGNDKTRRKVKGTPKLQNETSKETRAKTNNIKIESPSDVAGDEKQLPPPENGSFAERERPFFAISLALTTKFV